MRPEQLSRRRGLASDLLISMRIWTKLDSGVLPEQAHFWTRLTQLVQCALRVWIFFLDVHFLNFAVLYFLNIALPDFYQERLLELCLSEVLLPSVAWAIFQSSSVYLYSSFIFNSLNLGLLSVYETVINNGPCLQHRNLFFPLFEWFVPSQSTLM